ncbi:hypothetical protein BKA59DRAFT_484831 [Fusarium tricinctum]|uniref:Zn(2)-C6 fungal-type domain-containing protein n=1 Tax=Fusarium tricinctum TaxID=61284 RepID=A0A8K0RPH9_9HYPO|nr:hypothetical protein BKA59DRAFT_484831 [Fusarium tricinctum]
MDLGPPWRRRRPATACNQCRSRKVRCDGAVPCGPCSRTPTRQCEYSPTPFFESRPKPPQPSASFSQSQQENSQSLFKTAPNDYAHGLELFGVDAAPQQFADYHHAIESNLASYFPIPDMPLITGHPLPDVFIESPALTHGTSVSSGGSTYSRSASSRGGHSPSFGSESCLPLGSGLEPPRMELLFCQMSDEDQDYWLQTVQKQDKLQFLAYGFGAIDAFRPEQERFRLQMERFRGLEQHQIQNRDELSSTAYAVGSARNIIPARSTCDVLVDAYINTFETVFRILHVPSFVREYDHFWRQPMMFRAAETDDPLLCKLVVILALGSTVVVSPGGAFTPSSPNPTEDLAYLQKQSLLWISYGKRWLTRRLGMAQRTDLSTAQVLCLLALIRHVHDDVERSKGILVHPGDFDLARIGMQMGFHRDPLIRTPGMRMCEVETRRRLWATMVELSLQHSLDEGLPSSLSPGSFDCEPPSDITDEELESDNIPGASRQELQSLTASTMLVLLSRTQHLRLRCLHLVNSPGASKSFHDSHSLASELNSSQTAIIKVLRRMDARPSEFQLQLLQTYTWQFVRALHAPFAEQATCHSFHYSRKFRMEAAVQVLRWPPSLALATTNEDEGPRLALVEDYADACVSLRVHGRGYLSRVQKQAAVSLCSDLISELEDGAFCASNGASWKAIHSVIYDSILVYERRVRVSSAAHGRRELLFLAAAEAYINAVLDDMSPQDVDEAIARAVDGVTSVCFEVLDGR